MWDVEILANGLEETNDSVRVAGKGQGEEGGIEAFMVENLKKVMEGLEIVVAGKEANEESEGRVRCLLAMSSSLVAEEIGSCSTSGGRGKCKNVVEEKGGEVDIGEMEGELAREFNRDRGRDLLEFNSDRVSFIGRCGGGERDWDEEGDSEGERKEESEDGERRKRGWDGRMGNGRI